LRIEILANWANVDSDSQKPLKKEVGGGGKEEVRRR
jgi:hypothetical protein